MLNFTHTFFPSDQPTTCPRCGARTDFYDAISPVSDTRVEIHTCLSTVCAEQFVVEIDEQVANTVIEEE